MTTKTKFTYGYRSVLRGETVLDTDELYYADTWEPLTQHDNQWLIGDKSDGTLAIRRKIDPGAGYFIIPVGAKVEHGDEYRDGDTWSKSSGPNNGIVREDGGITYRRKIEIPAFIDDKTPFPFYYVELAPGECIEDGDQVKNYAGEWQTTKRPAGEVIQGVRKYCRKVAIDCGPRFHLVPPGETVCFGDDWFDPMTKRWVAASRVGQTVVWNETSGAYRRPRKEPREYPKAVTPLVVRNLGVGYRLLKIGEITNGAEALVDGKWLKTLNPVTVGVDSKAFRVPDAGEGYQLLSPGTVLEAGDEILYPWGWQPTELIGGTVMGGKFRRKIPAILETKSSSSVYRTLGVGDIIQSGDEIFFQNKWEPALAVGNVVKGDAKFRRPIPSILKSAVNAGEGYRFLGDDETLVKGDECREPNGPWSAVCLNVGLTVKKAREWFEGGYSPMKGMLFRRKEKSAPSSWPVGGPVGAIGNCGGPTFSETVAANLLCPGIGYRMLRAEEIIRADDEYWNISAKEWRSPNLTGRTVKDRIENCHNVGGYRRKASSFEVDHGVPVKLREPKNLAADTSVLTLFSVEQLQAEIDSRTFRLLKEGEKVLRGDQFKNCFTGDWDSVDGSIGSTLTKHDAGAFRRKK